MDVEVTTQVEAEAAISAGNRAICVSGEFSITVTSGSPRIVVDAKADVSVVAWESSQPRVEARGSSQPRVEAWESSQPRVVAWESSQPRVVAWGFSLLSLSGSISAKASANVSVLLERGAGCDGGRQTECYIESAQDWCDYYGVKAKDGVAVLYKALSANFKSRHGADYQPGTIPRAPDWDGGEKECGGGYHFSPSPAAAKFFVADAEKYVACPVNLGEFRTPSISDTYPQKIKAAGCCAPVWEVDEDGERVPSVDEVGAANAS